MSKCLRCKIGEIVSHGKISKYICINCYKIWNYELDTIADRLWMKYMADNNQEMMDKIEEMWALGEFEE